MQPAEPLEIQAGAVHDVERAGLRNQRVKHVDIMQPAVGDVDERRNASLQIQQRMELHGGLGGAEPGPREQRQAKIDGGRVQSVDGVAELQPQVVMLVQRPCGIMDEALGEVGMDAPVARPVGVGQGVSRDACGKSHVIELAGLRPQARFVRRAGFRGRSVARRPCCGTARRS